MMKRYIEMLECEIEKLVRFETCKPELSIQTENCLHVLFENCKHAKEYLCDDLKEHWEAKKH